MLDWHGERNDWDPYTDPWMDPSLEDGAQSGDPTVGASGGDYQDPDWSNLPGYGTDPNDGFDPEAGQNPTDYPPQYGPGAGSKIAEFLKNLLAGDGKGGSPLGNLGQVFGKDAAASANGRLSQAGAQNNQDKLALERYLAGLMAPSKLAGATARGDFLANVKPASISGLPSYATMPTITGGMTPAALGPNAHAAGAKLSRDSLTSLMNGGGTPPPLTPLPTPSGYDTAASTIGRVGSILGAISPLVGKGQDDPHDDPNNYDENGNYAGPRH